MVHEVDECIVKFLSENGPLSSNKLREKIEKETGRTPNTIYMRLRILKRDGIICRDPHDRDEKKNVWYYLPDDKSLLYEKKYQEQRFLTEEDKEKERVPYEIKKNHTKNIQEKVIKPWIEQLPDIYIDGPCKIFRYKEDSLVQKFGTIYYDKLEVENELLFEDFKKHISFYPNPFKLLEKLKEKTTEELDFVSCQFYGVTNGIVYNHLLKTKKYHKYILPKYLPSKAFFDLMKLKIIDGYLKETPLRLGSEILLHGPYEQLYKILKNINDEIPSQVKDGVYSIYNIHFMSWNPQKYKRDISLEMKSILDEIVIYFLNPTKESQSAGVKIAKKLIELYEIRKQMIKVLQQHLERNILAGECGYTIP